MDNPNVFNNYDIRGVYPTEVNEELAERLGRAIGTYAKGLVVVGGDTRDTTPNLKKSLIEGIRLCGCNVIDIGIGPT
ncbi:MAG: phosphomannomutase, partial [Candidatus Aenigmarchaeota archaeon]|nr:phosphomannomutase [Candidatus Aenigmarchaeota archaeon]